MEGLVGSRLNITSGSCLPSLQAVRLLDSIAPVSDEGFVVDIDAVLIVLAVLNYSPRLARNSIYWTWNSSSMANRLHLSHRREQGVG